MLKPLTLIVVTLAVVGSVVEYLDPAFAVAAEPKYTAQYVPVSEAKLEQLKGLEKTPAKDESSPTQPVRKTKVSNYSSVSRSRHIVTIQVEIKLGSPKNNKRYARWYINKKEGWGETQFQCLNSLWFHESRWVHTSTNSSSGAYGIPQALPADKMASAGSDWKTNPATQIEWGRIYIKSRYGTPCGAYSFFKENGWY